MLLKGLVAVMVTEFFETGFLVFEFTIYQYRISNLKIFNVSSIQ